MTSGPQDVALRGRRLYARYRSVLEGKNKILNAKDAGLFLEAILAQESPSRCVEALVGSPNGLEAVRNSVRVDLSVGFFQTSTLKLITFLSDPSIRALYSGQFLWRVLDAILSPNTVWKEMIGAFLGNKLEDQDLHPLAWLVHEVVDSSRGFGFDFMPDVKLVLNHGGLEKSKSHETRTLACMIQKVVVLRSLPGSTGTPAEYSPGGRHDNDFANFREISIYPTRDEFLSTRRPFYRTLREAFEPETGTDPEARAAVHIDNQFRLLREDMLAELRNDLQVSVGKRKGKRRAHVLSKLVPVSIDSGDDKRRKKCAIVVQCHAGLEELHRHKLDKRPKFLKDHPNYVKHQAFGALSLGTEVCGFAFVQRDENMLLAIPPKVCLQFADRKSLHGALLALKRSPGDVQFTLVDTPVFAYEPVLKVLQTITTLPLADFLMNPTFTDKSAFKMGSGLAQFASKLRLTTIKDGEEVVRLDANTYIDLTQRDSLYSALTEPVCEIQGPPGTGKTFMGCRAMKAIYEHSDLRVLVITYTNHALDDSIAGFKAVGIPESAMVRLGSKSTPETESMLLSKQKNRIPWNKNSGGLVDTLKSERQNLSGELTDVFDEYHKYSPSFAAIYEYLEFTDDCAAFHQAFTVPSDTQGWKRIGGKGRQVGPDYLYDRWIRGDTPGIYTKEVPKECEFVWDMKPQQRQEHRMKWIDAMILERVEEVADLAVKVDGNHEELESLFSEGKIATLRSRRIICCTTTAAAMSMKLLRAAEPDVLLVEEAGEILESHTLTALAPSVKQLISIGDHKQLRPKVKNYDLTVEKGDGYDLNMSLFERLVVNGFKHTTLRKQHRMHPDISIFPRALTYPDLLDGPQTHRRESIRGLRDRVIFMNHEHPETSDHDLMDKMDPGAAGSRRNQFEALQILRIVRYLAQQGYGTDKMVVLAAYLGQVRVLRDTLAKENDPILNDLDASDLLRAGLMTQAASKVHKRPLRISTIDNYQGEESDIVIASLTRSNPDGDIGFMSAPERVNVLLTRARCCLILLGNMDTFMRSKKGGRTWVRIFEILKENKHLYDGLPVQCTRHDTTKADLKCPGDFDKFCPDGGCSEPCKELLKCGLHTCPMRCHRVTDHSRTECNIKVSRVCERNHKRKIACTKKDERCDKCVAEDKETERRVKRDLELERQRLERQDEYRKELERIQDDLDREKRIMKDMEDEESEKQTLARERENLQNLIDANQRKKQQQQQQQQQLAQQQAQSRKSGEGQAANAQAASSPGAKAKAQFPSEARKRWEELKEFEGARSGPLDELMGMIGLEEVKDEFIGIKTTVDTKLRQGVSVEAQRYGAALLGNPGTGKTTVARIYAKFLTSIGAIAGSRFEETTGAKLAHDGVQGCEALIDNMLNDGGGVMFIDEAYQLTSGNNPGGGAVLDYLLAKVENLTGKIVFVLAGYNKQMESFFSHNPGLPSRFPIEMKFADYTDEELLHILGLKIDKAYKGLMKCEDGLTGLFCRIVSRRIGRGRGREGFGNARTVENMLVTISQRQSVRLSRERRQGSKPDDFLFTKEDLIGPKPSEALGKSEGWRELQGLCGLQSVKQSVKSLVSTIEQNYERELAEQTPVEFSLNKVFLGNPGTGKTTVAKLYGRILVDLGLLSKGEVVVKNPSDFVGAVLGQSEQNTKGILAAAVGKVLVIDEAYGLYGGGQGSVADPYKTGVIDTIVAEVQSVPGDDRCVLLLGYRDQMEDMFHNVNPGLSRRFPMSTAFTFEDFSDDDLRQILNSKLKKQCFEATDQAKRVAMEMLSRARNRPNFGNAGEIDIILDATKARHQTRFDRGEKKSATVLEALDFDPDFDRALRSDTNVKMLFQGTVGAEDTVAKLEGYQQTVRNMKALGLDPKENVPFNFLFRGPPGTGKTTTAKKMGKVFYDMGFLASAEVVECSASDLIGQYVGQTAPKVLKQLDKALGKVLFVDEAYRLAEGHFAKEAMDEFVDSATKDKYMKKLVIILAGYTKDINRLMSANSGLTSRFPEVIDFRSLDPAECADLLTKILGAEKSKVMRRNSEALVDISVLEEPRPAFLDQVRRLFSELAGQPNWGSARDVQTIARKVFNVTANSMDINDGLRLVVKEDTIIAELESLRRERAERAKDSGGKSIESAFAKLGLGPLAPAPAPAPPSLTTTTATATNTAARPASPPPPPPPEVKKEPAIDPQAPTTAAAGDVGRDAGVSDEVWAQLELDKKAARERDAAYRQLERQALVRRLLEEEERRRKEAAEQARLMRIGRCPVGYAWIKQAGGYRCAGGSHFASDAEIERYS
ncbi:hypothetical protein MAPG_11387 [Magnaporthiopsis poae ATCC 64411]|uniref:AAA+ ATPase domain-containing protein n=1 Tax=Magnaporthiopsis poae (strain ATCC 64411 / 73-15) TaxID=644358 RepID=A0A0C4EF53_MAGP6|nr:hypothetical protein MAPG_11387 [Magnaporthiopsis poae ATCC 64411]